MRKGNTREASTLCLERDKSFKELYESSFEALVMYIKKQFRSCPKQAEEIAQNAFEKMACKQKRAPIHNLKAFLWRTAHNIAVSDIRSKQVAAKYSSEAKRLFSSEDGYTLTPERVFEAKQQANIALAVLRNMPEQRRRAFILTKIEGLSHTEASLQLGISRPAVSKHVARATAELYAKFHSNSECTTKE